ncbi:MAG: acyl-CoA dehydrogenase family protein [Haloarculaceae archaeon]
MSGDAIDYADLEAGRDCNYWTLDRTLRFEAERAYDEDHWDWAAEKLSEWGEIVGTTIAENADLIDRHGPELHTYDRDGTVVNDVEYHPLQAENERLAYDHGIVADGFGAPPGRDQPLGLVHHLLMNGLLSYADPGFACPVAMSGGVALVLEKFDDGPLDDFYHGLTSRDHERVIEGAMFLTEKQGGSDVGANETTARPTDRAYGGNDAGGDGGASAGTEVYELEGEKWFCSNVDAEGTLALARRQDAPEGTEGLSLFLVPHTDADGELNDQRYRRLKDKLGTISVPTAEVELTGAEAYLVGEPEEGFAYMTEMLNLERLHNAFASVGIMGRALLESKVHAASREAFGETIDQYPLMRRDLVDMAVDYEAAAAFVFAAGRQFQCREETDPETDAARDAFRLMRALVPVAKYKTGRMAVETASYACEVLGGNGYVDGFVTERLLRDAQVLPIWEGTSNILSLDLLRALDREDAHEALVPWIRRDLAAVEHPAVEPSAEMVESAFVDLQTALGSLATAYPDYAQHEAKQLAGLLFDVVAGARLCENAQYAIETDGDARKALVASWFAETRFGQDVARGIADGDALPHESFDAFVRYAPVDPATVSPPTASD